MPELRKDPIIGRWVVISTEREKRPDNFKFSPKNFQEDDCPFCEGKESCTPKEIAAVRENKTQPDTAGWKVRIVSSNNPIFRIEGNLGRKGHGIHDQLNGIGAHEVIIETPKHIANICDLSQEQITEVFNCYVNRIVDLEKDQRFNYILIFKNYGWGAGATKVNHARSHLIAMPINPKRVKEELVGARRYFDYHERCVFCDIIRQEKEKNQRVVLETDNFLAIVPFASRFPFEICILPKLHSCDFGKVDVQTRKDLACILKEVLSKIKKGLEDPPYNYVIHSAPLRRKDKPGYWKTIDEDYHWHIEIIPRLTRVAGFEWGTGCYICPLPPEDAAEFLRGIKI